MKKKLMQVGKILLIILVVGVIGWGYYTNMVRSTDDIIVEQIKRLQSEADALANQGKELEKLKEEAFQRQNTFNTEYQSVVDKRNQLTKTLSDPQLAPQWTDPMSDYFKGEGVKKWSITEAPQGGSSETKEEKSNDQLGYKPPEYTGPNSLYYTCLITDNCYVTQSDTAHKNNNGLIAVDVGTGQKNIPVLAPDYKGKEVEYTVKYTNYPKTTGYTVELYGEDNGVKFMWRVGHIHWNYDGVDYYAKYNNKKVSTGTVVAISGGEKEKSYQNGGTQGATSGKHVHIEYHVFRDGKYVQEFYRLGEPVITSVSQTGGSEKKCQNFVVTAYYSPLPGQAEYNKGTFAKEKVLQGNGTNGASGKEVFDGMMAAPKKYAFGTKIEIGGKVYTVEDRGGAIVPAGQRGYSYDRLDIWMGKGDEGRIAANNWGKRTVEGCFVS